MTRLVLQQLPAELERVLFSRIGHLVEEALVEVIIHRVTDGTPEGDRHGMGEADILHRLIRDDVGLLDDAFDRGAVDPAIRAGAEIASQRSFSNGTDLDGGRLSIGANRGPEAAEAQRA